MKVTNKYVYFLRGPLGNWSKSQISYDDHVFFSSEQLFMYLKAKLFNDDATALKILHCHNSRTAKILGREVKGFDEEIWKQNREKCMFTALAYKYKYDENFRELLMNPEFANKEFVEANPEDNIWSIGISEDKCSDSADNWQGLNLLGKTLNRLRATVQQSVQ